MFERARFSLPVAIIIVTMFFLASVPEFGGLAFSGDLPSIKEKGVLRHLGIPYANFVSEDGKEGLDVELVKLFAQHLGVRYEYVPTSWEDAIGDLTGKRYATKEDQLVVIENVPIKGDILANGFTVLPLREKMVSYSIPTFLTQIWLTARSDSSIKPIHPTGDIEKDILAVKALLKGQHVLGKLNTCLDPSLYNMEETGATVHLFDGDLGRVAYEIVKGDASLSLLDMPDALIALEKWPGQIKIIGPLSPVQDMGGAFAMDSPLLRAKFNDFFKNIVRDGTYIRMVKKYYPSFSVYYPDFFNKY
jgi:ABC-type amino acid transport substrate-binding protein